MIFIFYESQWVGKLSILSIGTSAGPPKAPPLGLGHSSQQYGKYEPEKAVHAHILGAGVLESQVLLSQRLKDYQVPIFLPQLHTMQTVYRCREMTHGCWKSQHQTEGSSEVTEKGGTLILKVVYMCYMYMSSRFVFSGKYLMTIIRIM